MKAVNEFIYRSSSECEARILTTVCSDRTNPRYCLDPSIGLAIHRPELEERSDPRTPCGRRDLDMRVLVDADGLLVRGSGQFEAHRALTRNDAWACRALTRLAEWIGYGGPTRPRETISAQKCAIFRRLGESLVRNGKSIQMADITFE